MKSQSRQVAKAYENQLKQLADSGALDLNLEELKNLAPRMMTDTVKGFRNQLSKQSAEYRLSPEVTADIRACKGELDDLFKGYLNQLVAEATNLGLATTPMRTTL